MLREISQYLCHTYKQDVQIVREFLYSLPYNEYVREWEDRLGILLGESEFRAKLDEWDWSNEEIFRASFAVMCLRTWLGFEEIEVKLSELLKMYFIWYIEDCKGCRSEENYKLYAKDENNFVKLLRDTYYKIQKDLWQEETYLCGHLVFGDPPAGADKWKRIIAASKLFRLTIDKDMLTMPYELVTDI